MRALPNQPSLVQRVCEAIVSEIVAGRLATGSRLIQDELARALGVSRHPVQQALLLLRNQGMLKEAPGRGLVVASLEKADVRDLYQLREAMEALAARLAAARSPSFLKRDGEALLAEGRAALSRGAIVEQIAIDIAFHQLIARASGNALLEETMTPHWPKFRRIMAEVVREGEQRSRKVWDEHAAILKAALSGDEARCEALAREHLSKASRLVVERIAERAGDTIRSSAERAFPMMA